jgi:AcrR family transcriptional regulator/predicted DNA-binding transcriptional regulator AlpA
MYEQMRHAVEERSDPPRWMKIAQFAWVTGLPRSTIHHYLNLGILPPPLALGPRLHLYGEEHLERLREVERLQGEGLSLKAIAAQMARRPQPSSSNDAPRNRPPSAEYDASPLRASIVDAAVPMILERGYEGVCMNKVARAAGIGRAALYVHFPSKADLLMICLDRLAEAAEALDIHALLLAGARPQASDDASAVDRLSRLESYRMIVTALASASCGKDEAIAERARTAIRRIARSAQPALLQAVPAGGPQIDAELLVYMMSGALMGVGARLALGDGRYSVNEALGIYVDFMTMVVGREDDGHIRRRSHFVERSSSGG